MRALDEHFCERAVFHLREEYLQRIETASAAIDQADLWWRPHEGTNGIGNLLLHLEGNVRQWILHGLAGESDRRDRDSEFDARSGDSREALLARLRSTVVAACAVIEGLDAEELTESRRIQGFRTTGLGAVLHVVEHFAWHTGQIVWMAKLRAGAQHGIAFYDDRRLQNPQD